MRKSGHGDKRGHFEPGRHPEFPTPGVFHNLLQFWRASLEFIKINTATPATTKKKMLATSLCILTIANVLDESIRLRTFSLVNTKGQSVFHDDFDRRRLADTHDRLALKFRAKEKKFEFELQRSRSILAPAATIRMTGNVREHQ